MVPDTEEESDPLSDIFSNYIPDSLETFPGVFLT